MGAEATYDLRPGIASALEWWCDAGVDMLVDEDPRDWLARPGTPQEGAAKASAAAPPVAEILPTTLEDFVAWRLGPSAPEANWMTSLVGPVGVAPAKLVVMVDMPDDSEAHFGAAAGRLFDRMLAAIGLGRESIYLCSLAVARPLAGGVPADQAERIVQLARHHLTLLKPARLLLLGQAAERVLGGSAPANGLHDINLFGGETRVAASFHPRFLLERPAAKSEAWKHLLKLSREGL